MRKYLHNKNWDKSKSILYPLVHAKGVTWRNVINPDETYLYLIHEDGEETILDGKLTVKYCDLNSEEIDTLTENNNILFNIEKDNDIIIVYDIIEYIDTINLFLLGKYSKFPLEVKHHILRFWENRITSELMSPTDTIILLDTILFPYKYFKQVAMELDVNESILRNLGELGSIIDLNMDLEELDIRN